MRVRAAAAAVLMLLAAGCTEDHPAWRTSTDPVTTTGEATYDKGVVRLSDGTEVETGRVWFFAPAGDGIFFVPAEHKTANPDYQLEFAAPGEPAIGTGMVVMPTDLAASPNGRYLAILDRSAGEKDRYGVRQAATLVFDLKTGEQIVDSALGMGDPATEDFAAGYSESEISIRTMTDTRLYVQGVRQVVFDLETGDGEVWEGMPLERKTAVLFPR